MTASDAIVVAARRTPFCRLDGDLCAVSATDLAATTIRALLPSVPEGVLLDDVLLANATGPGGNLARVAALDAGCDVSVPGMAVDRQCSGGLDAVTLACRLIQAGAGECYIAGGCESPSTSPLRALAPGHDGAGGRGFFPRRLFSGGGHDDPGMAESAEAIAAERDISRERQDAYAAASHIRAVAASTSGHFRGEIVACDTPDGPIATDTCLRPTLDTARLGRMPGVVRRDGTVTAGNASQIADGAVAVLVVSRRIAERTGIGGGLRFRDAALVGVDPRLCGLGAIPAARALAARNPDLTLGVIDQVAMVEAFASQMCATIDALSFDVDRVNPSGGAIAIGHPWAASGALQVLRLLHDLRAGQDGLALAAVAGGMGSASWWTRESA